MRIINEDNQSYQIIETKYIKESVESDNDSKKFEDFEKVYTIKVSDPEDQIINMLNSIQTMSKSGHSFSVLVDPYIGNQEVVYNDDRGGAFYIDGDGVDRIDDIKVEQREDYEKSKYAKND